MNAEPVIDPEAIADLRLLNPEDDAFLREIIALFIAETPTYIAELHEGQEARDAIKVCRAAHSIKGSASNLGARRLSRAAERVEHAARGSPLPPVEMDFAAIAREFEVACQALRQLSASLRN